MAVARGERLDLVVVAVPDRRPAVPATDARLLLIGLARGDGRPGRQREDGRNRDERCIREFGTVTVIDVLLALVATIVVPPLALWFVRLRPAAAPAPSSAPVSGPAFLMRAGLTSGRPAPLQTNDTIPDEGWIA